MTVSQEFAAGSFVSRQTEAGAWDCTPLVADVCTEALFEVFEIDKIEMADTTFPKVK